MEDLEYITKKAMMECTMGGAPGIFSPTYNQTVKINGCLVSTIVDQIPMANIPTFVVCKVTKGPCTPAPTGWLNPYPVKIKGQQTLLGRCSNMCGVGGKISFLTSGQIPLEPEEEEQLNEIREDTKKAFEEEQEENNKSWWQKAGEFAVDCIPVVGPVISLAKNVSKGNWGMALLDVGFLALDVVSIAAAPVTGGGSVAAATAAKVGIRQAIKAGAKKVARKLTREAIEAGVKQTGEMLSKLAVKNLTRGKLCVFACFPAGTPVATKDGLKNIEEIQVGDQVWSYDENKKRSILENVLHIFSKKVDTMISILLENGEIIETTNNHEFWTIFNKHINRKKKDVAHLTGTDFGIITDNEQLISNDDWIMAENLVVGDLLLSKNKTVIKIIDIKSFTQDSIVYNFLVPNYHNYYIGKNQLLVHNKACYVDVFFKAFPELKGLVSQVHHAIPQKVFKQWPELFDKSLKNNLENLRGIAKEGASALHQGSIHKEWNKFYKAFEKEGLKPTKEQIEAMAKKIDDTFGHLFLPPIR